jgi:Zn finger protein HypA/HybF involved in hydrogenase expression
VVIHVAFSKLRLRAAFVKVFSPFGHEVRTIKKFMAEGYCVKCKAKREIADGIEEVMKNGRKAIKGKCPVCGTVMFKILGGKAMPPVVPAVSIIPPATS